MIHGLASLKKFVSIVEYGGAGTLHVRIAERVGETHPLAPQTSGGSRSLSYTHFMRQKAGFDRKR